MNPTAYTYMDRNDPAQDRGQCRAIENMAKNLWVPEHVKEILE
jgi:hypothetical protein